MDADELAGDTIPCSPEGMLRDRDTTTQPTQILGRPSLGPREPSSSPSVIEVPASSPFQPQRPPSLGSRLAPAGTLFRPPPRGPASRPQPPSVNKRPAPEPISLLSDDDDEDNLAPPRGDIRPTSFQAKISSFRYEGDEEEKRTKANMRKIWDKFGTKYNAQQVREALKLNQNDVQETIAWLKDSNGNQRAHRSIGSANAREQASPVASKPKRRLVQGRRQRSSSPDFLSKPHPPSSDDPLVIDLIDDKEDAYEAEPSPAPSEDEDDHVLQSVNGCTVAELGAMTGMKEEQLQPLTDRRPFDDLAAARRVSIPKKLGARKNTRISIGETVVEAIQIFLNAATAIDKVVQDCETKAKTVKDEMESWDLDTFGHDKRNPQVVPGDDDPPTPTSLVSPRSLVRPPIARQPRMMDGHCEMKPFQLFGLNWMSLLHTFDIGCILADEMGLGKTCQVISLMCHLVERYEDEPTGETPWPNLIVVPPSTYNNWLAEFERFAPDLSVIGYRGSQAERAEIAYQVAHEPDDYHVVLATYSQINSDGDVEAMQSFNLHAAIFDEGHKMKNPETKIYRDLKKIPATWKMLLTGTPVQNNLLEMTSLLSFINPRMFDGYMDQIKYIFSQKVTIKDVSNGAFLYSERVRRARTILEPFILQRRKDQVLSDLPGKTCNVVYCEMSESQKTVYNEYEELFRLQPMERIKQSKGRQNDLNNVWMQLRKAAIHPLLFRRHFTNEAVEKMGRVLMDSLSQDELHQPDIKHLIQELKNASDFELHLWCRDYPTLLKEFDIPPAAELDSGKVKKLIELIQQYQANGDRVLVFSKFSRLIELLQEVLALQGINHLVLMGNTNVAERQSLIDEFNENEDIPVFLLTTGAGGTGINLTAANKVIIFDQSDNPQDDIQAENRAHRLGQKRDVEIIRLLASHTIEELIYKACQKKIELANKVTGAIEQDAQVAATNLEKEVRKMLEEQMTPP